jgi:hypothetical protein
MSLWKHQPHERVEELLRANRPEPDRELIEATVARVRASSPRRSLGVGRMPGRFAAAVAISALALVAATAAAGGVGNASHGVKGFVVTGAHTFGLDNHKGNGNDGNGNGDNGNGSNGKGDNGNGDGDDNNGGDDHNHDHDGSGDHQYKVRLCHFTHDKNMPYVELLLSPQGALEHLLHHPFDYIPLPGKACIEHLPYGFH